MIFSGLITRIIAVHSIIRVFNTHKGEKIVTNDIKHMVEIVNNRVQINGEDICSVKYATDRAQAELDGTKPSEFKNPLPALRLAVEFAKNHILTSAVKSSRPNLRVVSASKISTKLDGRRKYTVAQLREMGVLKG